MSKIRIQRWCGALALGAGSLMAFGAHAAGTGSGQSQYQMDVQRCNSGDTSQDRATCLREAGAARQESQRNRLDDKQEGRYQDNAMMRCKNLPASQQQDCITQMTSGNTTTRRPPVRWRRRRSCAERTRPLAFRQNVGCPTL